ncbi:unnamed protein product, partial [Meganyctiphanes norvegica]
QTYGNMSLGELADVRRALLGFVQDLHIRVSVFLKEKVQTPTGRFVLNTEGPVPYGSEVPGPVRVFLPNGEVDAVHHFQTGCKYIRALVPGSLTATGPRQTTLGTNMYTSTASDSQESTPVEADENNQNFIPINSVPNNASPQSVLDTMDSIEASGQGGRSNELNLLAQLIGAASSQAREETQFRLNLFQNDNHDIGDDDQPIYGRDVITIEGSQRGKHSELGQIFGELTMHDEEPVTDKGQDLLDLMDSA